MLRTRHLRKYTREWAAAVVGVAALGIAALVLARGTAAPVSRLTMTAGGPHGLRHQFAERIVSAARRHRLALELVGTAGSEEALAALDLGKIDVALVQGGLDVDRHPRIRQVAALQVEPLHLLVKEELHLEVSRNLAALRGKRINLSEPGSGTYRLALEVLGFAGLTPRLDDGPGDFEVATLGYGPLLRATDRDQLPDAAFMVSTLPSPVARHLVTKQRFRLVSLSFGEAFELDALHADGSSPGRSGIDKTHVYSTVIPAFTYGLEPAVPAEPIATFGTRLLLVARAEVEPRAVCQVLDTVFSTAVAPLVKPPLEVKLLELPTEYERHPGTVQFLERAKPLIAGDAIDFLEKTASLTGALLGGLFFLWQWVRQRYRRQREVGFEAYMKKVTAIENQALRLELGALLDLKELVRLQADLSRLKSEALEKFASGELGSEELISGFLTHINDARNYLARLILHERDNLEEQALRQKRTAGALWNEAVGVLGTDGDRGPSLAVFEEIGP